MKSFPYGADNSVGKQPSAGISMRAGIKFQSLEIKSHTQDEVCSVTEKPNVSRLHCVDRLHVTDLIMAELVSLCYHSHFNDSADLISFICQISDHVLDLLH